MIGNTLDRLYASFNAGRCYALLISFMLLYVQVSEAALVCTNQNNKKVCYKSIEQKTDTTQSEFDALGLSIGTYNTTPGAVLEQWKIFLENYLMLTDTIYFV